MAGPSDYTPTDQCDSLPQLTHTQRSRLVKSTRKLAKVLGENPMPQVNPSSAISFWKKSPERNMAVLRGPILSAAKKLARAALDPLQIVYRRDPGSDNEDMHSIQPGPGEVDTHSRGGNWSSMLALQAVSSCDSEIDDHSSYVSSQVPSPATSLFSKRPSSVISTCTSKSTLFPPAEWEKSKEEREISYRRKRLSKLARHLGERIPPDLILPKPRSAKPNRRSSRKKRFFPGLTPPVPSVVPPLLAESPTSEKGTTPFLSPPSPLSDAPRPAVEKTVEVFESTGYTPDAVSSPLFSQKHRYPHNKFSTSSLRERTALSPTNGYFEVIDHADAISFEEGKMPETGPLMVFQRRPESRLAFLRPRPASPSPVPNVVSHRSERRQGWSGEWNVASMQDVISKLRDL
ncbi:hypothetical protein DFH94DRAFT_318432 [Russula ochroleuca]|jgi:hypothetical protein|uniref:Uncharacterized protein n=1 Tax=Russula ochroleuca TaxID=152965 RepID=A0A9P5N0Z6_9AGAM|nr:hypothetical protein DFH94DRAFT_318432 [Russula ochroleuca]